MEQLFVRNIQDITTRTVAKYVFFATRSVLRGRAIKLDSTNNAIVVRRYVNGVGSRKGFQQRTFTSCGNFGRFLILFIDTIKHYS